MGIINKTNSSKQIITMKLTTVFLIATLFVSTWAVKTNSQTSMSLESTMTKLNKSPWGQVAASFLDLQMTVGSPVGDLVQAFQDFLRDNQFKIDINTQDYNVQLAEHNEWEAAIRERIASAQSDIATATSSLENVLYPLKAALEDQIARDEQLVVDTLADMDRATNERAAAHAENMAYVEEANMAIDAIDECVELLAGLDSGAASMVQVTKVQRSFKKVSEHLKNTKYGSMIKALLKLADFANSDMLQRLQEKFAAVRAEMVQSIADTLAAEDDQLAAYTAFMAVSQQTVDDARQRIVDNRAALAQCIQDIADIEAFREQRQADLAVAEEDLATEIARWAAVEAMFEKLFAELANEADAISDVIDVVSSITVSEETFERLNQ